jgi:hypothetical protein
MFSKKTGIAAAALFCIVINADATEHIVNGTFSAQDQTQQDGWTTTSNAYFYGGNAYHEGSVAQSGYLSQTVTGAVGNAILSFDYDSSFGYQLTMWNGVEVNSLYGSHEIEHYSFAVTATGNDVLTFIGRNDPSFNHLSNVSVYTAAVPEPATYGMLLAGLAVVGGTAARRKKLL